MNNFWQSKNGMKYLHIIYTVREFENLIISLPLNNILILFKPCEKKLQFVLKAMLINNTPTRCNYSFSKVSHALKLTLSFPRFPFDPHEKHQKAFGFLMFSGGSKGNTGKKRVNKSKVVFMFINPLHAPGSFYTS